MAGGVTTPAGQPLVLGIDPGLRVCGWGLVQAGAKPEFVACGVIKPPVKDTIGDRLLRIQQDVATVISTYGPQEMAIEDPFMGSLNPGSALAIGQARAAALLAAAAAGLPVAFYAPRAVKAAVSSFGASDKRQVQAMVRLLLNLDVAPEPWDAADALAVALTHLANRRMAALASGT